MCVCVCVVTTKLVGGWQGREEMLRHAGVTEEEHLRGLLVQGRGHVQRMRQWVDMVQRQGE